MIKHKVTAIEGTAAQEGFLGPGHMAKTLISANQFQARDPFILLMDDQLDLPGGPPVGGPHPHAGFETITLVIQGDGHHFETGSLEVMTAGKGIIHSEEITTKKQMRILQLWLTLPKSRRWVEPSLQKLSLSNVPKAQGNFGEIRVYSGKSQGLVSPVQQHTPFMLVEYRLRAGSQIVQEIPSGYRSFIYVLSGSVSIGGILLTENAVGWLDVISNGTSNELTLNITDTDTHFLLYGGEPQQELIVSNGPFVGNTRSDIQRLYDEYYRGEIPHLEDLDENKKTLL